MPKYNVTVERTSVSIFEVEADDAFDACDKALELSKAEGDTHAQYISDTHVSFIEEA